LRWLGNQSSDITLRPTLEATEKTGCQLLVVGNRFCITNRYYGKTLVEHPVNYPRSSASPITDADIPAISNVRFYIPEPEGYLL